MVPYPGATFGSVLFLLFLAAVGFAIQITVIYAGVTWALRSHDQRRQSIAADIVRNAAAEKAASETRARSVAAEQEAQKPTSKMQNVQEASKAADLRKMIG